MWLVAKSCRVRLDNRCNRFVIGTTAVGSAVVGSTAISNGTEDLLRFLGMIHGAGPGARVRLGLTRGQQKLTVEGVLGRAR